MAKISLDLNQFKANGVYTVEFDESDSMIVNTQQLRLIVGFSRKGPFNAPVFLKDTKSARKIFGEIDTLLEKRGSFFHRSIETALTTGPVYALNLLPLDNRPTGDKIEYRSFSMSMDEDNSEVSTDLYASFYNKERFWKPDTEYFSAIVNNNKDNVGKLISFTNLGQSPMSIIVRKAKSVTGFDITARDFYGEDGVPEYVGKFDYIRDYFIDIYAVKGDWTDYANLSIDPDYSNYFDESGIKVTKLDQFLKSDKITMIGSWTGCIIPDFIDQTGANQYIETIVNNSQQLTGLYMVINRDALDDYENSLYHVDMIGNSLIDGANGKNALNMLSYVSPIEDEISYISGPEINSQVDVISYKAEDFGSEGDIYPYVKSLPYTDTKGHFDNVIIIPKPRAEFDGQIFTLAKYNQIAKDLTTESLIKNASEPGVDDSFSKISKITNTGSSLEITVIPANPEDKKQEFTGKIKIINETTISDETEYPSSSPYQTQLADGMLVYIPQLNAYVKVKASSSPATNEFSIEIEKDTMSTSWLTKKFEKKNFGKYFNIIYAETEFTEDEYKEEPDEDKFALSFIYALDLFEFINDEQNNIEYVQAFSGSNIYKQIANNSLINGDKIMISDQGNEFYYLGFETGFDNYYNLPIYKIFQYKDEDLTVLVPKDETIHFDAVNPCYKSSENSETGFAPAGDGEIVVFSDHAKIKETINIVENSMNVSKTEFRISSADSTKIEVGQYLVTEYKNSETGETYSTLTRVVNKTKRINPTTNKVEYIISVNEPLKVGTYTTGSPESITTKYVYRYLDINDVNFTSNLQFTKLGGFTLTSYHLPNNSEEQLEKIYGVLENTNVGKTLADNDIIQFRYIVDTFGNGLKPGLGAKSILSRLAMKKQKCMAILNAPKIQEFIESVDPRFTDEPDPDAGMPKPLLNCEYISTGGNLSLGPRWQFSLPDEDNGAKFCGVFTPFIKIKENNKDKMIPPAADVSNNFIKKLKSGTPYAIAAGPRRGIINNAKMTGLEYDFLKEERGYLEPFGLNCLTDSKQYGPMIYGNATAYQKTLTAFNNLHVRDLLVTIETDIEDILSNYVFEFNDAATRLEMKTIVEGYLANVKASQGIYDYMVIMDETNNTNEVIDQNIGIMDIGIEPARGMHKIINRVTVLKTGTISSGGFTIN